jgi:Dimerisation domain
MAEPSSANFVNRLFFGHQNSAVLKAALELDVFTAIGAGALDVAALAAKSDASPRGMAALCDSLVVMGFLAKSSAGYTLTPDAAVFLDRNSPACIASVHEFLAAPEFVAMMFEDPAGAVRRGGAPSLAVACWISPQAKAFLASPSAGASPTAISPGSIGAP